MTGPGEPSAPAGWYPDPDGAAGMVRWWSGASWSDVTTPAGPGVTVQAAPRVAPAPPVGFEPPGIPRPPSRQGGLAWGIGLGILALVVVVVVALLVGRGNSGASAEGASSSGGPPVASGPAFPPGTVRIIDQDAGIAYPYLGDGWSEWDRGPMPETAETVGQYFVTQEQTPDGIFIAQCTSGALVADFGYAGPDSLGSTLQQVADRARASYYPAPNEQEMLRDEDLVVDGAPAHLIEFRLSWDVPGYDATGERAALLLIDVGRAEPALLYLSVPNTQAELYGVIDQVIASVDVL